MIAIINTTAGTGSTGKICLALKNIYQNNGKVSVLVCSHKELSNCECFCVQNKKEYFINNIKSRLLANEGLNSKQSTKKLVNYLKENNVELIHLNNIHGHYINFPILFNYIKENNIPVIWTLHDCWPFTGHCPYFSYINCEKWKTGCYKCPLYKKYPESIFDNSKKMYAVKRQTFTGVKNLTIVTPSEWLKNLVKVSFLKEYDVKVINNGIDLNIFKPYNSNIKERYNINEKFVVLGVAFCWGHRKGLDIFIELSKKLNENYKIVLVGTDEDVDNILPKNILSIHRTNNQKELAELYSSANVFVNPTREDNYPTVNLESLACGTPVITFNTGGSPEPIDDKCGRIVNMNDIDSLTNHIIDICENHIIDRNYCLSKSKQFDMNLCFRQYDMLCDDLLKK